MEGKREGGRYILLSEVPASKPGGAESRYDSGPGKEVEVFSIESGK